MFTSEENMMKDDMPKKVFIEKHEDGTYTTLIPPEKATDESVVYVRADIVKNLIQAIEDQAELREKSAEFKERLSKIESHRMLASGKTH